MDKKKLKDIILKTLEKEGGAAGLKALAKAAKTSKNKLKKDLDDMSGVKQHQDGDYISTPINERETANASMAHDGPGCTCKCPAGYGTPTMGSSTFGLGGGYYTAEECQSACSGALCYELEGGTTTTSTPGLGKGDLGIEPIKRPSKPIRKPMRLRETEPLNEAQLASSESGTFIIGPPMYDPPKKFHTKCNYDDGSTVWTNNPPCPDHPNGAAPGDVVIPGPSSDFKRPDKKLREVKEIIETMLGEKKKKKKDRCHKKADQVYGTKTSAYKSGAIVRCRNGEIWKKK